MQHVRNARWLDPLASLAEMLPAVHTLERPLKKGLSVKGHRVISPILGLILPPLKTLTSLNKEVRPFFLSDDSIWGLPSVSSLSDYSIWRS